MFKPTQDYILVQPARRRQSDILEVISNEKFTQGTVVAIGPGKYDKRNRLRPLTVKPGDFITYGDINLGFDFYPKYEENGIVYRILQEADVCFIADHDAPEHAFSDERIARMVMDAKVLEVMA
jgi:co-chaperonin GroES (HSP10)